MKWIISLLFFFFLFVLTVTCMIKLNIITQLLNIHYISPGWDVCVHSAGPFCGRNIDSLWSAYWSHRHRVVLWWERWTDEKRKEKQMIHVFMVRKADAILRVWWEICWYRCTVPQCNIVLLDIRILQLEGLLQLIVLASSVSMHVFLRYQIYCSCGAHKSFVRLNDVSFDPCQCYLCVHSTVVSHRIRKIAAGEQAIPICHGQESAV